MRITLQKGMVNIDGEEVIEDLQPYEGAVYKDGKEVCSFYDYC